MTNEFKNIPTHYAKLYTQGFYKRPKHIKLIEKLLVDAAIDGNKRLIINLPPRSGKSELISKYFPAWYLLNYPTKKLLLSSYAASFASHWVTETRNVYKYFSSNELVIDRNNHLQTVQGGYIQSSGAMGDIMGKGADMFIIDDPIKNNQEAESSLMRDKMFNWFNSTVKTRLMPNASIIILMTRWHTDDLAGRLINQGGWDVVSIPAICDSENDVLNRKIGEPLWNEMFNIEYLNNLKSDIGNYWFNCLYQQSPIQKGDTIFKADYFQYKPFDIKDALLVVTSYDTAFKDGEYNDFTGYVVGALYENEIYILESGQKKLEYQRLKPFVESMNIKYKPYLNLVEDKASGQSLIQELKYIKDFPLKAIKVKDSKLARAQAITTLFEMGKIKFVGDGHHDLIKQMSEFPYSQHDDIVDALTQLILYFKPVIIRQNDFYF